MDKSNDQNKTLIFLNFLNFTFLALDDFDKKLKMCSEIAAFQVFGYSSLDYLDCQKKGFLNSGLPESEQMN
ncbi:hypothetical protein BpHYR1_014687 [Brachionus plicatilis]|uniref:Uncharacterized protein n=1 Tax=Brachionus plicatilis TaxID=10195 RepID=A0A3M7RHI3_BRAPC|nr:hypothetical protein BpHYR1_014687 [Brachionus plicatilis]